MSFFLLHHLVASCLLPMKKPQAKIVGRPGKLTKLALTKKKLSESLLRK